MKIEGSSLRVVSKIDLSCSRLGFLFLKVNSSSSVSIGQSYFSSEKFASSIGFLLFSFFEFSLLKAEPLNSALTLLKGSMESLAIDLTIFFSEFEQSLTVLELD